MATNFRLQFTNRFQPPVDGVTSDPGSWWSTSPVNVTETYLPGQLLNDGHTLRGHSAIPKASERKLRWGILGLGRIAKDFAVALKMTGADITSVAAGSLPNATARAQAFANTYSVPQSWGTYEDLAADPNVDIVYIATINTRHFDTALLMLQAGKNVLLEKPMTMNYREAQALEEAAIKSKRLLLTNYWTRFFPVVKYARSVLASNRLGTISSMRGDFGFATPIDIDDRFLNRQIGGGAMLDVGCYLVNLAVMVNPSAAEEIPSQIQAISQQNLMGTQYSVDTEMSFSLNWNDERYQTGLQASKRTSQNHTTPWIMTGQASFRRPSSFEVEIDGTHGRLVIHSPANAATAATVYEYTPFGPMKEIEVIRSDLPPFDATFGPEKYPRGSGFVYIIQDIEACMLEKGIPGTQEHHGLPGCLELEPLTMKDQLNTVQITDLVLQKAGYWDW